MNGYKVMLDYDLAELYGVTTKALNQAMKRNPERFPSDFSFQLTKEQWESLRSQIVTSKRGEIDTCLLHKVTNCDLREVGHSKTTSRH